MEKKNQIILLPTTLKLGSRFIPDMLPSPVPLDGENPLGRKGGWATTWLGGTFTPKQVRTGPNGSLLSLFGQKKTPQGNYLTRKGDTSAVLPALSGTSVLGTGSLSRIPKAEPNKLNQ